MQAESLLIYDSIQMAVEELATAIGISFAGVEQLLMY